MSSLQAKFAAEPLAQTVETQQVVTKLSGFAALDGSISLTAVLETRILADGEELGRKSQTAAVAIRLDAGDATAIELADGAKITAAQILEALSILIAAAKDEFDANAAAAAAALADLRKTAEETDPVVALSPGG